jgi:hypothetical protein
MVISVWWLLISVSHDIFRTKPELELETWFGVIFATTTEDNHFGIRFPRFPAGTRRKVAVFGGNTPENGRKVEAGIRWSYLAVGFSRLWLISTGTCGIPQAELIIVFLLPPSYHFPEFSLRNRSVPFHLGKLYRKIDNHTNALNNEIFLNELLSRKIMFYSWKKTTHSL